MIATRRFHFFFLRIYQNIHYRVLLYGGAGVPMNDLGTLDKSRTDQDRERAAFTEELLDRARGKPFAVGQVVMPLEDLAGIKSADGEMLAMDALGPGIVEAVDEGRGVQVHWLEARTSTWLDPQDLRSPGAHAHLVSFYHVDGRGNRALSRRLVDARSGLEHNWVVERLPGDVVRSVRDDGLAWTFDWYRVFRKLHPKHTHYVPLDEDADAEALAAAELFFS